MFITFLRKPTTVLFLASILSVIVSAQVVGLPAYKSQGASQEGETPVLVKHLPEWESVSSRTTYSKNVSELERALGDRPVLDLIDFSGGTEAVTAPYDAGILLVIEYSTPQASIEADAAFAAKLSSDGDKTTLYRRIGNYNVFVFDAADPEAANALLDQVKYEKVVQWLGRNPYIISAERAFVLTTSDIFLSTFLAIVGGLGFAIFTGIIAGYAFFSIREYKRSSMPTFSDAGGMTRLNLDGFTPEIMPEQLLKD